MQVRSPPLNYSNDYYNRKLLYREEHSASVVLSWCTLLHFSGVNLLMTNQPLLRRPATYSF